MIKQTLAAIAGSFLIFATQTVFANDHERPANAVDISAVIQNVQAKGYQDIREVEFDDGVYKVKAVNANGKKVNIYIDPQKNEILNVKTSHKVKKKNNTVKLSMLDAIKKVEAAGYHAVYEIDVEHHKYEIKALDKAGKKARLQVNGNTGKVSKKLFD